MSREGIWADITSRIRNHKEKQLLLELQTLTGRLEASLHQLQQSKALAVQYEAIWRSLLVCRRSHLMAAIPLTGQRLSQLRSTAGAITTSAQQLLPALQSATAMLGAFAAVNRATAEELEQAGAMTLALEKLQLAGLEDQLMAALEQLMTNSKQQLAAAAAAAHQQQHQAPCAPALLPQQQQLQPSSSAIQPAGSGSNGGQGSGTAGATGPSAAAAATTTATAAAAGYGAPGIGGVAAPQQPSTVQHPTNGQCHAQLAASMQQHSGGNCWQQQQQQHPKQQLEHLQQQQPRPWRHNTGDGTADGGLGMVDSSLPSEELQEQTAAAAAAVPAVPAAHNGCTLQDQCRDQQLEELGVGQHGHQPGCKTAGAGASAAAAAAAGMKPTRLLHDSLHSLLVSGSHEPVLQQQQQQQQHRLAASGLEEGSVSVTLVGVVDGRGLGLNLGSKVAELRVAAAQSPPSAAATHGWPLQHSGGGGGGSSSAGHFQSNGNGVPAAPIDCGDVLAARSLPGVYTQAES